MSSTGKTKENISKFAPEVTHPLHHYGVIMVPIKVVGRMISRSLDWHVHTIDGTSTLRISPSFFIPSNNLMQPLTGWKFNVGAKQFLTNGFTSFVNNPADGRSANTKLFFQRPVLDTRSQFPNSDSKSLVHTSGPSHPCILPFQTRPRPLT